MLNLKLTKAQHFMQPESTVEAENRRLEQLEMLKAIDDGNYHDVKITTNILDLRYDRRDQRLLTAINGVKLIYKMANGGSLILIGNLVCSFRQPFGGEFFVKKVVVEENTIFDNIVGAKESVFFTNYPVDISSMQNKLAEISKDPNLVFNLSQFDEFMEIFKFYKSLSSELNNNTHYSIERISRPYYFVPIDQKEIEVEEEYAIKNQNGIVIGYKLEDYKFENLSTELQDCVLRLIVVKIKASV